MPLSFDPRVPVIVRWVDSLQADGAWEWLDDHEEEDPCFVTTLGFILSSNPFTTTVAQSLSRDSQTAGRKVIVTSTILEVREIRDTGPVTTYANYPEPEPDEDEVGEVSPSELEAIRADLAAYAASGGSPDEDDDYGDDDGDD
jgi:hypothetical protein